MFLRVVPAAGRSSVKHESARVIELYREPAPRLARRRGDGQPDPGYQLRDRQMPSRF